MDDSLRMHESSQVIISIHLYPPLFSLQPAQKRNGCEGNKISPPNRFVGISEVVSRKFTHEYIYKLKVLYLISKLQVYM